MKIGLRSKAPCKGAVEYIATSQELEGISSDSLKVKRRSKANSWADDKKHGNVYRIYLKS